MKTALLHGTSSYWHLAECQLSFISPSSLQFYQSAISLAFCMGGVVSCKLNLFLLQLLTTTIFFNMFLLVMILHCYTRRVRFSILLDITSCYLFLHALCQR